MKRCLCNMYIVKRLNRVINDKNMKKQRKIKETREKKRNYIN